jgi:hypothetical protein
MGLSMYINVCSYKPQSEVDFKSEDCINDEELFYWRNDYDLHMFMEVLYDLKGGEADSFNCVNVELTLEDLESIEEYIHSLDFESDDDVDDYYNDGDDKLSEYINFIEMARVLISQGKFIYYSSWW